MEYTTFNWNNICNTDEFVNNIVSETYASFLNRMSLWLKLNIKIVPFCYFVGRAR